MHDEYAWPPSHAFLHASNKQVCLSSTYIACSHGHVSWYHAWLSLACMEIAHAHMVMYQDTLHGLRASDKGLRINQRNGFTRNLLSFCIRSCYPAWHACKWQQGTLDLLTTCYHSHAHRAVNRKFVARTHLTFAPTALTRERNRHPGPRGN
jgi:hypothetical protein